MGRSLLAAIVVVGSVDAGEDVTYYAHVEPILRRHCTICHSDANVDDRDASGGLSLSTPEAILKSAQAPVVVPGRPDRSRLLARLVHPDPEKRMPKGDSPLADKQIGTIRQWIEGGCRLGTPVPRSKRRPSGRPRRWRDLQLELDVTPPAGFFAGVKSGRLTLVANIAPLAPVTALAFSPDGKHLACGSFRRVIVWRLDDASVPAALTDPIGLVHALEFAPDGKTLWSAGGDPGFAGELRAYRTADWKPGFAFDEAADVLFGLAISPDGTKLATTSYDRMLRIFALPDVKVRHAVKAHSDFAYGVAISKDGTLVATGGKDNAVKVWDANSGKLRQVFSGHDDEVLAVLFSPDGASVYATGREPQIRKWSIGASGRPAVQGGHGGIVYRLAWNRTWSRFVSAGSDQSVRIWRPDATPERTLIGAGDVVYAAALSPDGKLAASGGWNGYVRVWDADSGRMLATLLSADRVDGLPPDWLALVPQGYFAASPAFADRARWQMTGQELPFQKVAQLLARPAELAKALNGRAPPVPFSSSNTPTKPAAPAQKPVPKVAKANE